MKDEEQHSKSQRRADFWNNWKVKNSGEWIENYKNRVRRFVADVLPFGSRRFL